MAAWRKRALERGIALRSSVPGRVETLRGQRWRRGRTRREEEGEVKNTKGQGMSALRVLRRALVLLH